MRQRPSRREAAWPLTAPARPWATELRGDRNPEGLTLNAHQQIRSFYGALMSAYGPQGWWPGKTCVEIVVGAILAQNTAWTNVERAIAALRTAGLLDWTALRGAEVESLAEHIRPSGTYRVKARRVKALVAWFFERFGGDERSMFATPLPSLRGELLGVPGIGPETADAILLYAGGLPTFVVDAYTTRLLRRHGLVDGRASYEAVKALFEDALPADAATFNEYHALIVAVGKRHCRPNARCEGCPLEQFPHDGQM